MKDYYQILGVQPSASLAEIKRAHRDLARATHPDHNSGDKAKEELLKDINQAYGVLSDRRQRELYDQKRAAQAVNRPRTTPPSQVPHTPAAARNTEAGRAYSKEQQQKPKMQTSELDYLGAVSPQAPAMESRWPFAAKVGLGALGIAGAVGLGVLVRAASKGRATWDPTVQRNRGQDGRFMAS